MHNGERDISRDVLQSVANAIRRVAAGESNTLVLPYGLPATTLPESIGRLGALQSLSLIGTGLESLPDSLGQLQLRSLQVASSPLERLPTSLTSLTNLKNLMLTALPLEELPADLGRMQSLRRLTLGGGHYARLPDSVIHLSQLYELSVKSSHLGELPQNIGNMQALRSLEVSSSKLKQLPGSLTRLRRLKALKLSGNSKLAQLPEDIGEMERLMDLSLKGCAALRHLPDSVGDLSQLQRLDLRGTGLQTLPQCLARLPATCEIKVPDGLSRQLDQIRNPQAAQQPLASRMQQPAMPAAGQAEPLANRGLEFTRALRRIDDDLGKRFDKWMQGLAQNAMILRQPLTPADMRLLDQVVAEAIMSPKFRSRFSAFLRDHTNITLDMDGMTQVGGSGGLAVRGDVKTAFAEMLKQKIMPEHNIMDALDQGLDQGAALSLLQEAMQNPDLGLSRNRLLHSMDEFTGRTQMWPPLRAYIAMHDVEGKAAQEAAEKWSNAQGAEALEGVIGEAEALREYKQAQANANTHIEQRARALLKEWRIN
ncbi:HpaF protein [Xanthomonas populi]|uniref:HpaF protein n=1 Tax=Xanthomonas populi TaxID=53414 RepID=A0A2S7E850_9XANT|nr:type III secretion system effector XopAE [Xanthomonas populi]PPU86305.1 HpaF protein [Xanthomonas populi]